MQFKYGKKLQCDIVTIALNPLLGYVEETVLVSLRPLFVLNILTEKTRKLLENYSQTNMYIFRGPRKILFFGRDTTNGETLDEEYGVKR